MIVADGALVGWASLGAVGSLMVALAGPRLVDGGAITWWFTPSFGGGRAVFYAGMALLCVAWLGAGHRLREGSARRLWIVGALWALPLVLGPVLFSRDVYSYLAQGEILRLGLNPYKVAPVALAAHGQRHLLHAVSLFWRHSTAPYGPLFLLMVSPVASLARSHLVLAALLVRLFEVAGVVLLGLFAPRLASVLGADPRRAAWLVAFSPLVLLALLAAGHNDALMTGLMVAGVWLAVTDRPLWGVFLCASATTIKVPAAAAIVFIVVVSARAAPSRDQRWRLVGSAALITVAVLGVVTVVAGAGLDWISTSVFSTPHKVQLAITPGTAVGYTIASLLHDLGASADTRSLESAFGGVTGVLTVALAAWLLWRVRMATMVRYLGIVLVAAALGGPAAWPWYLIWGLALLAACPEVQRSWWMVAAVSLPVFLVKPDGILLLPRSFSPAVLVVYIVIGGVAWVTLRRRRDVPRAVALT
jgi:hypothetical protein